VTPKAKTPGPTSESVAAMQRAQKAAAKAVHAKMTSSAQSASAAFASSIKSLGKEKASHVHLLLSMVVARTVRYIDAKRGLDALAEAGLLVVTGERQSKAEVSVDVTTGSGAAKGESVRIFAASPTARVGGFSPLRSLLSSVLFTKGLTIESAADAARDAM